MKKRREIRMIRSIMRPKKCAALLRGVNVGGHMVKMADLKIVLESVGLKNVKTLLASGNGLFDYEGKDQASVLERKIELILKKNFGFDIPVILRSEDELLKLVKSDPFKGIKVTPQTRLYVTFLKRAQKAKTIKIPYSTPGGEFRILKVTPTEIISVLQLEEGKRTPDLMNIIEKEFGKEVTTRNWNTVLRLTK